MEFIFFRLKTCFCIVTYSTIWCSKSMVQNFRSPKNTSASTIIFATIKLQIAIQITFDVQNESIEFIDQTANLIHTIDVSYTLIISLTQIYLFIVMSFIIIIHIQYQIKKVSLTEDQNLLQPRQLCQSVFKSSQFKFMSGFSDQYF